MAHLAVEQGPGRAVFLPGQTDLRAMAAPEVPLLGAQARDRGYAAPAEKEVLPGPDHEWPVERAMGESPEARLAAVLRCHPGVG